MQPQVEVNPPAEVRTSNPDQWRPPKRPIHEGGTGSDWVQLYDFAQYAWPWSSRTVNPPQTWKGAERMRVRITVHPEGDERPIPPIRAGMLFGGPLLDCQNGTAQLVSGLNELVLPFRDGGWEWRAGRSSLAEWGAFSLEKIGPVMWIMLMLTGEGRTDRGSVRVESVAIE